MDVFGRRAHKLRPDQYLLNAADWQEWASLTAVVLTLAAVDYFLLPKEGGRMSNLLILAFWIIAGLAYNVYFFVQYGKDNGAEWCTGFILEWMLSIDNLFVFHLCFKVYRTPPRLMQKALFFGILGAVGLRMVIYFALGSLMQVVSWIRIMFGFILIYSGIQAVREEDEEEDVSQTYTVRTLRWILGSRLMESYDMEGRLFPKGADGRRMMSLNFYVIVCLQVTDVLFAVDSVSAKVAQISNQYTAYSSSVMAMFGLRAMFFVLKDLVDYFEMLKYGLCIILVFVGGELIMSPFLHLDSGTVCIVILSVFTVSLTASTAKRFLTQDGSKSPDFRLGNPSLCSAGGSSSSDERALARANEAS